MALLRPAPVLVFPTRHHLITLNHRNLDATNQLFARLPFKAHGILSARLVTLLEPGR
jgi:hypothetical protein